MLDYLILALVLPATTYQWGEQKCGQDVPIACAHGAVTASGEELSDDIPSAALPLPKENRMRPTVVRLTSWTGACVSVRVNDKSNPRWIGKRGLDLNKAALILLVEDAHENWQGEVEQC